MMKKRIDLVCVLTTLLLACILMLAACASVPPPTDKISNLEIVINRARQNEAGKYAPLELRLAEEKLQDAKAAVAEGENEEAAQLADKGMADARLAEAKARAEKTRRLSDEMADSVDNLRDEIERNQ